MYFKKFCFPTKAADSDVSREGNDSLDNESSDFHFKNDFGYQSQYVFTIRN